MKDNSDQPSLINFPQWKIYTDKNDQKKSDKDFGERMRKILKGQKITQPEMAKRLGIKPETFKKILSGKISVRRNKDLRGKIAREFDITEVSILRDLGILVTGDQTPTPITIAEAKKHFATALLESDNYLEFFIAVFKIAQSYNVPYKVIGDAEIDKTIDDLDAVQRLDSLKQAQYAEFFLEFIGGYAAAGTRKKIARKFIESKLVGSLSQAEWKDILRKANSSAKNSRLPVLRIWFEVLDEMAGDRKI